MKKSSWNERLPKELEEFLREERTKCVVYPSEDEVFSAFQLTRFEAVKVVILGQDPYHGLGQAHGLAFSVKKGITPPPSLKNIFKELKEDLGVGPFAHGYLENWAKQGVFLLNTLLTVRKGEPMSHQGKGWEEFTDRVVENLCLKKDPIVFMLWGKWAKDKGEAILLKHKHPHLVLKASHPSPFSVRGFLGCKHFSKANAFLQSVGKAPIDWRLYE